MALGSMVCIMYIQVQVIAGIYNASLHTANHEPLILPKPIHFAFSQFY